jgi:hypothetical protein
MPTGSELIENIVTGIPSDKSALSLLAFCEMDIFALSKQTKSIIVFLDIIFILFALVNLIYVVLLTSYRNNTILIFI